MCSRLPAFLCSPAWFVLFLSLLLGLASPLCQAQTLAVHDDVQSVASLTSTAVTLTGRAELRITGTGDPLIGCVINFDSPEARLLLPSIKPSVVVSTFLSRIKVKGVAAVADGNVRVVAYSMGTMVIPESGDFQPLEIFDGRYFIGKSTKLSQYTAHNIASLGSYVTNIASLKLKRGYMATLAQNENGTGQSRNYVAAEGDLDVGRLPAALEGNVRFIRVFPWRWISKNGIAGNLQNTMNTNWWYNWSLDQNSSRDREYVAIRQTRYWPGLGENWKTRGINHLLGFNEPDHTDQANMTVADAIASWPDLLGTGLRVGSPSPSDGGLSWLYNFMTQADTNGLRVDYVAVHYYRSYSNPADPTGAANQMYNFVKGVYDQVKRPIWITEWNNGANWTTDPDPTAAQQQATVAKIIEMLDSTPFVERYAIYNWVEDVRRVAWDDGSPTAAGVTYRDNISPLSYRQEMADPAVGVSAKYSFDGQAEDMWGNGHDAMAVGTPTYVPGRFGDAVALDGTDDYLQMAPAVGDSADFTFAAWIYWNGGANWQRVFDLGFDTLKNCFLTPKSGSNTLRFTINTGGGEQQLNSTPLPIGVWTHVAVTIAGDTGKLFVNGVLANTNTAITANPINIGTKYNYLGKSQFPVDPLFGGRLDDVRFLSSALTDAQVTAIATSTLPQFLSQTLRVADAAPSVPYSSSIANKVVGGVAPLTFLKMEGPAWLTVAANGTLGGTPSQADIGENACLVRVTDANGSIHTTHLIVPVPQLSATIVNTADDAEESAAGVVNLTSTDLELVNDGALGNQVVGLRFAGVSLPQGATISDASIQFTTDEISAGATELSISVEETDHAAPFIMTPANISSRPAASPSVYWQPEAWNTLGEAGPNQRTPNLSSLVQKIVSRPDWTSGNALVFTIRGTGHRAADSANKTPTASPPKLNLRYSSPPLRYTVTSAVTDSKNDAEESAAGVVSLNSTDLELVNDGALGDQAVGLRFEGLAIPSGASIVSATLQFSADEAQSEPTNLTIRAQTADNAPVFAATANNLISRPLGTASITWQPAPWLTVGESSPLQAPPDLSSLVQEVVSRPGWVQGNALVFLLSGTGHRTAEAADKLGEKPVTLQVTYDFSPRVTRYRQWANTFPNLGPSTADPDADGQTNLLEYALKSNPLQPDRSAQEFPLTLTATTQGNTPWMTLTYQRNSQAYEVATQVEWSDNPAATTATSNWSTAGVVEQILNDDGTKQTIQARIPTSPTGKRFARIRSTASAGDLR